MAGCDRVLRDYWGIGDQLAITDVGSTEPIRGWRSWMLHRGGEGFALGSSPMSGRPLWVTDGPMRAECLPFSGEAHDPTEVPAPHRDCGIHARDSRLAYFPDSAWKILSEQPTFHWMRSPVWGSVWLTGRIAKHAKGWRAEFARVAAIEIVCSFCDLADSPAAWLVHPEVSRDQIFLGACDRHQGMLVALGARPESVTPSEPARQSLCDRYGVEVEPLIPTTPGVASAVGERVSDEEIEEAVHLGEIIGRVMSLPAEDLWQGDILARRQPLGFPQFNWACESGWPNEREHRVHLAWYLASHGDREYVLGKLAAIQRAAREP